MLLRLALKNASGNRIRTVLTIIGVSVAIFIFCFFQSIQDAMSRIIKDAGEQNNLVVMEKVISCPSNSYLPDNYVEKIEKMPEVEIAMPVLLAVSDP